MYIRNVAAAKIAKIVRTTKTCEKTRKIMEKLKVLLAKGRIYESVYELLNDVGISIYLPDRTYFPTTNQDDLAFQVVKPQITSILLAQNKADVGFSGKDWVYENGVQDSVEEIMDLGFDKVRIVAAIRCSTVKLVLSEPSTEENYIVITDHVGGSNGN